MWSNGPGAWVSDREKQRIRSLSAVFQKTDRILLTDRNLNVRMVDNTKATLAGKGGVPGWTKYPDIFINYEVFNGFHDPKTLVQLLGLNYHELSHCMFSPNNVAVFLPDPKLFKAYNILEDQRIESLFTAMYQPAGKYFTETCVRLVLNDESAWPVAFLWTHGRSYLPLEIREEMEERFILSKIMRTKAKRLIDHYKKFTRNDFENNFEEVQGVIMKFSEILSRAVSENSGGSPDSGCGDPEPGGGEGVTQSVEKNVMEKEKERREEEERTGEDQSGFWEEDESDDESEDQEGDSEGSDSGASDESEDGAGEGSSDEEDEEESDGDGSGSGEDQEDAEDGSGEGGDGDAGNGDSDGDVPGDESGDGDSEDPHGDEDDSDRDGELNQDPDGGGEAGGSDSTSDTGWDAEDLKDYLDEIIDAVNDDSEVQNEVQNITAAMNDLSNIDVIDFGEERHEDIAPNVGVNAALQKVTQHFRKLYAEVEPGWLYGSDVGKLNVGRYMQDPDNLDEAFDEWDEGREHESGLEVFISLDISGSMQPMMLAASTAMWMIKRACDDVNASTTVVGFHGATKGLFDRNEKAAANSIPVWQDLGGNTLPSQSMHLARSVLSRSDLPNKLFVIITDGGWGIANPENRDASMTRDWNELIESIPGTRVYIELGGGGRNDGAKRSFHVAKNIVEPTQIVPLVEATITKMLTERRR